MDCCRQIGPTGKEMADDTIEQELPDGADAQDSGDQSDQSGNSTETSNGLTDKTPEQVTVGGILPWIVTFVVAVLCAGAGLTLGRLFAAPRTPETAAPEQKNPLLDPEFLRNDSTPAIDSPKTWYYDLEPVTVNLNEPGFGRYVRAAVTLQMDGNADSSKGKAFLDREKTLLANRLTVYLASLNTENLRGEKNLEQVRSQILDLFNKELFPDSKPRIKQILLKQLAISISIGG
jgi:flagellar basal body-associated protein FliL